MHGSTLGPSQMGAFLVFTISSPSSANSYSGFLKCSHKHDSLDCMLCLSTLRPYCGIYGIANEFSQMDCCLNRKGHNFCLQKSRMPLGRIGVFNLNLLERAFYSLEIFLPAKKQTKKKRKDHEHPCVSFSMTSS